VVTGSDGLVTATWMQDRVGSGSGAVRIAAARSRDGGRTWSAAGVTGLGRCDGGDPAVDQLLDPWLAAGPDGTTYLSALLRSGDTRRVAVTRSGLPAADGALTWSPSTITSKGTAGTPDKPTVTTDPRDGQTVYATWASFSFAPVVGVPTASTTYLATSHDGGSSWTAAAARSADAGQLEVDPQLVVTPDGTLVCIYMAVATSDVVSGSGTLAIRAVRSTDHAATWSSPLTIATLPLRATTDPDTGDQIVPFLNPAIAADRLGGHLAVAWPDTDAAPTPPSAWLSRMTKAGPGRRP
jgi:hypothetical protein